MPAITKSFADQYPHGPTDSGKTTFIQIISTVPGDSYASTTGFTFFIRGVKSGVGNDLAQLQGAGVQKLSLQTQEGLHNCLYLCSCSCLEKTLLVYWTQPTGLPGPAERISIILKPKDINYGFHSFEFRIARYERSGHFLRQRHSECIRVRNGKAGLDARCR